MKQNVEKIYRGLTLIGLVMLCGCSSDNHSHPVDMIVGIDISCQAKARLLSYAKSVYDAQRHLPTGSHLRVYTFGHGNNLIYNGDKIAGRDAFNRKVGPMLEKPSSELLAPQTQTDLLFDRLVADTAVSRSASIALVYTDGGMEDQGSAATRRLKSAVERLSASESLQAVVLIGVKPRYRLFWEKQLLPLGARALVCGDNDAIGSIREQLVRGEKK